MLKKITALLISVLLLFNAAGFLLIFKIQQEIIHENVKERISNNLRNDSQLLIIIKKSDLKNGSSRIIWEKEYKEFRYKGKLYDVIKYKESDGKLYLYCWNDYQEEELYNNVCSLINKNFSKRHFITINLSFYIIPVYKTILPLQDVKTVCVFFSNHYQSFLTQVPTPPPRQA